MGTVQGVYMKYVLLSASSYSALYCLQPPDEELEAIGLFYASLLWMLVYTAILNGIIAVLFWCERGMSILGKDPSTGQVPAWSYTLFAGFHFPTWLYTCVQRLRDRRVGVAVADEVAPGWWLGGRYGHELGRSWAGIIDLTCEFPETCQRASNDSYLLVRCWDGVPPTAVQLEQAAEFATKRRKHGNVIVHCAHGRGRSTTTMCACLVKWGLYKDWEEAFHAVKKSRPVVKLNSKMRRALTQWQDKFVAGAAVGDELMPTALHRKRP
mmetsp:Transcript_112367/g.324595  ORF Transcript_112367/g.324595 Transcript_112367/m.324595 type:complete len:267 (+) Transcript_112367:103-903(+)